MTQATILVVEDNPITRKMVRVALSIEGYTVLEAPDGRTALELVAKTPPDLVLQDLLLPDMDGFELVGRLRGISAVATVPILAFSGFLSRLETAEALALGFSDFLVKPVEPSRLVQTVRTYLPAPAAAAERPGRGRRVLVVDDDSIQLKLAQVHLEQLGFRVTTASHGAQALVRAREAPPDAILSDVLMPRLDGFQLCLAVRQDPRLASVPVVLCSANYLNEADRGLAERVGANALVTRTPDFGDAIAALLASLSHPAPPAPEGPVDVLEAERLQRVVRQLERQAAMNVGLIQQLSLQASALSMLAGLSSTLARPLEVEVAPAELLASLLDAGGISTGAIYLTDPDGRLRFHAQSGHPYVTIKEAERFFGHLELFEQCVELGQPITVPSATVPERTARGFLGRVGAVSVVIVPLVSGDERLGALLMAANRRDLTHKDWLAFAQTMAGQIAQTIALGRAFSRLTASEQRYRSLVDNLPVGLYRITPEGRFLDANPALVELLGFSDRESLLGVDAADLYADPEDRQRLQALTGRAGVARGFEARLRRRDGTLIWARLNVRTVREEDGGLLYEGSLEDITERKQAEDAQAQLQAQLVQSEKLATMGSLLAGVAHELNNPLSVVLGHTALLCTKLGSGPLAERALKIGQAAERCARIVKNFLALARQRPPERREVRLNDVVRDAVELVVYPLRVDNVTVRLDLAPDLPPLWADPHQLHQVVVNLVTNAHHAMRETAGPRRLTLATRLQPAPERVVLEVSDTGPGIPPEIVDRIFEPFFTTKPAGRGTGLGLSLCRGILESHGGTIQVESAPGQGAVLRVELPVTSPRPEPPAPPASEAAPVVRKTILVVDDESDVAEVLADMLTAGGHEVETAPNGRAALEKVRARAYDLVLTDLRMPELDGPGFYREVERRHPELVARFVFLTGDSLSPEISTFLDQVGGPSLSKPFDLAEVRRVTQRLLHTA